MKKRLYFIFTGLSWLTFFRYADAQPTGLPLQSPANRILDRLEIRSGVQSPIHSELRPYSRRDAVDYAKSIAAQDSLLEPSDRRDLQYLFDDNSEWLAGADGMPDSALCRRNRKPVFGIFYRNPAYFFEVNSPSFHLRVNPVLHVALGKEKDSASLPFFNRRGLEVRGDIDNRVFFYTNVEETQAVFPNYVNQRIDAYQAIPGAGFFKTYQSGIFHIRNGYDYNLATACVGYQLTRHIGIQLGHGQHFIGNGYRSLFLSDAGNNTFYLKFSTRIWRLHYQNLFLELSPISTAVPRPQNSILPKKYVAAHYLNFRVTPDIAVGFFEATVFNRSRQFELQYLNPVILYRTVEGMIGSPDNVLVGFDGRWNLLRRFQLYGQILIDEFLFSAWYKPEEKGWWGNKFGWQAGVKYVNAFSVDQLDLQLEFNSVRPYTYSSFDSLNSYTHYNQALAHPLLANFREWIGIIRYRPFTRLEISGRYMRTLSGENTETENWGANPLLSNSIRVSDYGNFIGQGIRTATWLAGLDISWQAYHHIYLDARVLLRKKESAEKSRNLETRLLSLGVRMNMWNQNFDF